MRSWACPAPPGVAHLPAHPLNPPAQGLLRLLCTLPKPERQRLARALHVEARGAWALPALAAVCALRRLQRCMTLALLPAPWRAVLGAAAPRRTLLTGGLPLLRSPRIQILCPALALVLAAWLQGPALWDGWDVARRNVYCEARGVLPAALRAAVGARVRRRRIDVRRRLLPPQQEVRWDEGVRQPVNTFSNLPFALTGAHMLAVGVADARAGRRRAAGAPAEHSELERFALFSLANGAAQLWVAGGSLLFHGSWTRAGQRADMGAVYAVLLCPAAYVAQRLGLFGPGGAHGSFASVVLATGAWFTVQKWRLKSSRMVPALIGLLAALQALWFCVGSPPTDGSGAAGGGGLKRWLWGPLQRRRPEGLAWPLLVAAAVSIAVAFGACAGHLLVARVHSAADACLRAGSPTPCFAAAAQLTGCSRTRAARRLHRARHGARGLRAARLVSVACRLACVRRRSAVAPLRLLPQRAAAGAGQGGGSCGHATSWRLRLAGPACTWGCPLPCALSWRIDKTKKRTALLSRSQPRPLPSCVRAAV
jgi:hypothetical protein